MKTNEGKVKCPRCESTIFASNTATLTELNPGLEMLSIQKISEGQREMIHSFWTVNNMMTFENIGFSKSANDGKKYLICAECEVGPLGFHDPAEQPLQYHIAVERTRLSN
jgi:hypothetical protein